jgi:hypothetical protein
MRIALVAALACFAGAAHADAGRALSYPEHGFTIEPPVGHDNKAPTHAVVMFYLPPSAGFAPNVVVSVYKGGGSIMIATATADESQWPSVSAVLKRSADSLQLR